MILAKFFLLEKKLVGFEISGHSGYAARGKDIVCAGVSTCAYMVANTVTEIFHVPADVEERDGFMSLTVKAEDAEPLQPLFEGFRLQLRALAEENREYLKVRNASIKK